MSISLTNSPRRIALTFYSALVLEVLCTACGGEVGARNPARSDAFPSANAVSLAESDSVVHAYLRIMEWPLRKGEDLMRLKSTTDNCLAFESPERMIFYTSARVLDSRDTTGGRRYRIELQTVADLELVPGTSSQAATYSGRLRKDRTEASLLVVQDSAAGGPRICRFWFRAFDLEPMPAALRWDSPATEREIAHLRDSVLRARRERGDSSPAVYPKS